jgi:hypothetical protein
MMTQDQIQKEIVSYKNTKRLTTHPYIHCTVTGEKVMAFGSMLEKKINRFGGLENMLKTFVSRKTKSSLKEPKPIKQPRKKKQKVNIEKVNEVYDIPIFKNTPNKTIFLTKESAEYTKGACMRPDIFLNSNRTCDHCSINSFCLANNKTFSKKYDHK